MKCLVPFVAAVALAACATPDDQSRTAQDREPKEYRTGSHLPVRNPSSSTSSTVTADTPAMQSPVLRPN